MGFKENTLLLRSNVTQTRKFEHTKTRIDKHDVLAALDAGTVTARYAIPIQSRGKWWRARECPTCQSSTGFAIKASDGRFRCHSCETRGCDWLALVALCEGLNIKADFRRVLAVAADIAGVAPVDVANENEWRARQEQRERERTERERVQAEADAKRQETAIAQAPAVWDASARIHPAGYEYLRNRGLGSLCGKQDVVRFNLEGKLRCPLYSLATGKLVNVVTRHSSKRVPGLKGISTGETTFGSWSDFNTTAGAVFLVEGLTDYLSGRVLFAPENNLVLGAHGASSLPKIVAAIARAIREAGRTLCLVVDADAPGHKAARDAIAAAVEAGLDDELGFFNLGLGAGADLNDALQHCTGDVRDYDYDR